MIGAALSVVVSALSSTALVVAIDSAASGSCSAVCAGESAVAAAVAATTTAAAATTTAAAATTTAAAAISNHAATTLAAVRWRYTALARSTSPTCMQAARSSLAVDAKLSRVEELLYMLIARTQRAHGRECVRAVREPLQPP
jgi:hypothetical protein